MATTENQTSSTPRTLGSLAPDTFESSRPDKIVAEITGGYHYPQKLPTGKYMTKIKLEFSPDADSGYQPWDEQYTAGWLPRCIPSDDGESPLNQDEAFYAALGNGTESIPEEEIENYKGTYLYGRYADRTDWRQFINSLATCGFQGWTNSLECLFGLKVYVHRVDPEFKNEKPGKDGKPPKNYPVLIVGDIIEDPTKSKGNGKAGSGKTASGAAAKGNTASTAKKAASTSDDADGESLESRVEALVTAELSDKSPQATQMVFKKVLAALTDANEKRDGLALLKNKEWLEATERPWMVDGANLVSVT